MMGHTHALFGMATLVTVEVASRQLFEPGLVQLHPAKGIPVGLAMCLGAAIVGALMPDLDAEQSSIQGELGLVSSLIRGILSLLGIKHRGVLHSGVAVGVVFVLSGLLGWWLGYPDVGLAFGLGYFSHVVIADALTISGVPLLWPLEYRFHLLPKGLRVRTGGPVEGLVFLGVVLAMAGLVWVTPDFIPPELVKWFKQWVAFERPVLVTLVR